MNSLPPTPPGGSPSAGPEGGSPPRPPSDTMMMGLPPRRPRRWRLRRPLVITAVVALVFGVGAGVAAAVTGSPSPSPSPSAASPSSPASPGSPSPAPPGHRFHRFGPMLGPPGFGWLVGPGPLGAVHGQLVLPKPGGGYETIDTQRGQVTAVGNTSITVKSADGFAKTYVVSSSTIVDARRDGIGSIKVGDRAAVTATQSGGTATAASIVDLSHLQGLRQRFFDGGLPPPADAG